MDAALKALAEPRRRAILKLVWSQELPATAIAERFPDVSRPAVSQHLKVLLDAGLVSLTPKGTSNIYALQKEGFVQVLRWIDEMWAED